MKKITYIITHKATSADRNENLMCVLEWLNNIDNIEKVIVVEQGYSPVIENIIESFVNTNYILEHKFLHNPNPYFNKCWAFNYGAKLANTEWLAFGDNDVLMDVSSINNTINSSLDIYDSFTPYETVFDLNYSDTKMVKGDKVYTDVKNKPSSIRGGAPYGGGIFFIKRDAFFNIGAWDERFVDWGAEDEDITHRIVDNLKSLSVNNNAYHLYHERTVHSTFKNEFYDNNLKIFLSRRGKPLSDILIDYNIDNIGLPDKYTIV